MSFLAPRKKSLANFRRRTFLVEPLESRSLLAGDVMAALDATGHLVLTGEAKANEGEVNYDTTAGAYLISGVNTTINGGTLAINLNSLLGAAFNGNVNVNL